jgi:hypothetical protein
MINDPEYAAAIGVASTVAPAQLRGVALCCGPFDMHRAREDSSMRWFLETIMWAYSGTRDFANDPDFAMASVTRYVGANFPPTFITVGNAIRSSVMRLPTRCFHGVDVDALLFRRMAPRRQHEYQFHLAEPAAVEAFERMVAFFSAHSHVGDDEGPFPLRPEPVDDEQMEPDPSQREHPTDRLGTEVLPFDACEERLEDGVIGRVAMMVAGEPVILPVNYMYVAGAVVFRTARGEKAEWR